MDCGLESALLNGTEELADILFPVGYKFSSVKIKRQSQKG